MYLIQNCQIADQKGAVDVRIIDDTITDLGDRLLPKTKETVLNAHGGHLLPGLHDHHIHLVSLAASLKSTQCGPPAITDASGLIEQLREENKLVNAGWLRGIGYHHSVAGEIDRYWLDQHTQNRPVRIQHRGGRLWILNSRALEELGLLNAELPGDLPAGIEFSNNRPTGRFYECDSWLRQQLNSELPRLAGVSHLLASYGITGVTDTTPANGPTEWAHIERSQLNGELNQKVRMMGSHQLPRTHTAPNLQPGEYKIHLLESQLPLYDSMVDDIRRAHEMNRPVAIHCVTHAELVFALSCLETAGAWPGDRIEHASVTSPEMLTKIADLSLRVITQPHFILERGDRYRDEVDPQEQPWLYRLQGFVDADIPIAAGSDAPFGSPDPWRSMQAAITRATSNGHIINRDEALTPEQALALYTSSPEQPGINQRTVTIGANASLCLLDSPWNKVRQNLAEAQVMATWVDGKMIYHREQSA